MVKRKVKISAAERRRRSLQARKNFGLVRTRTKSRRSNKVVRRKTTRRRSVKRGAKLGAIALGAGLYGAARSRISQALAPISRNIPFAPVADELGILGAAFLLGQTKIGRGAQAKRFIEAAMFVELARIGEAAATGQLGFNGSAAGVGSSMVFAPTIG